MEFNWMISTCIRMNFRNYLTNIFKMFKEELESWKVEWIKLDSSLGPYNAT